MRTLAILVLAGASLQAAGAWYQDPCTCSPTGVSGEVPTYRPGCAQHSLSDGDDGWYCMVVDPALCQAATPSQTFLGAAWIECTPAPLADSSAASAAATANAAASSTANGAVAQAVATASTTGGVSQQPHRAAQHPQQEPAYTSASQIQAGQMAAASAQSQAVAQACGLAQAVAVATAEASGYLPARTSGSASLQLSATAIANASALAYSPGCTTQSSPGFGCALAQAVANSQRSEGIKAESTGPQGVPIMVTLQASAYTTAVAQAGDILGSGRCGGLPASASVP